MRRQRSSRPRRGRRPLASHRSTGQCRGRQDPTAAWISSRHLDGVFHPSLVLIREDNELGRIKSATCAATVLQPNLLQASKASKMPRWTSYAFASKPATGSPKPTWWPGMFCSVLASDPRSCNFSASRIRTANWSAKVQRETASIRGKEGFRIVGAAPPRSWPDDCHDLHKRWKRHGISDALMDKVSPSEVLALQLDRLKKSSRKINCEIDPDLTPLGCRHGYAVRIHTDLNLTSKEGADVMGHSEAVHLSSYGQVLDTPKTLSKFKRPKSLSRQQAQQQQQ